MTDTPMTDARWEEIERWSATLKPHAARRVEMLLTEVKRLRALRVFCPSCGRIPMTAASRPATSPETCPACGSISPLLPLHVPVHHTPSGTTVMIECGDPFHSRAK